MLCAPGVMDSIDFITLYCRLGEVLLFYCRSGVVKGWYGPVRTNTHTAFDVLKSVLVYCKCIAISMCIFTYTHIYIYMCVYMYLYVYVYV